MQFYGFKSHLTKLFLSYKFYSSKAMNFKYYDAVIFDMGGVLISGPLSNLNKFEAESGLEKGSIFKSIIAFGDNGIWARWEKGEFAYNEFKGKFEEEYLQRNGRILELKSTLHDWLPYNIIPQMIEKVKSLRLEGYKTALLTNNMFLTPGNSFQPIDNSIFDVIVESCKLGIRKPSEKIFELCLDKLGVEAEKAVFLDDIGSNLVAASKMGIMTIKVTDPLEAIIELDRVLSGEIPHDTIPISSTHEFNIDSLVGYLEEKSLLPKLQEMKEITARKFSHGQSNPTFYLKINEKEFVLRKKPPGKLLPSAHGIEREYSIMNSIIKYGVPVPRMIHLCEDSNIIGTPFYLMEYNPGSVYKDISLPKMNGESRADIYRQVCDVLCKIHKIDPNDCGIEIKEGANSTRKEYLKRNINRWWKQYESSKIAENVSMEALHEWLMANIPNDPLTNLPSALCHGDFRLDNLIFLNENGREKLTAVLDWELSCLGDPITDLATACFPYYMPLNLPFFSGINFQSNLPEGIPTMHDFINNYCTQMSIKEISNFKFYQCFVLFKFAVILTGVSKRALLGQHSGHNAGTMGKVAVVLSEHGIIMAKGSDWNENNKNFKDSSRAMPLHIDDLREEVRTMHHAIKNMIDTEIIPSEKTIIEFYQDSNNVNKVHPLMEEWKEKAKRLKLWNLFLPISNDKDIKYGQGLTNLEYSFLCEQMGRSLLAPEVFNCSAPDTGNMEILAKYGTDQQKQLWLLPLLEGKIRSCFGMTEPGVASSDARNIMAEIRDVDNDEYIINGHKWWISGAMHPMCDFCIFMGKTDATSSNYTQQSMIIVPMNSAGVKIIRPLHVFGYLDPPGCHAEITFTNVRVPKSNILLGEGKGFQIAQGRLGPGRVHHCMRMIGYAERSMELVLDRITTRETFGKKLSDHGMIQQSIAKSRIEIEQARLLVMKTAHMMDQYGSKKSKQEIAMIKVAVPNMAVNVIDRAIQCFGGAGFCEDYPLSMMYSMARVLRVADGPDEVHIQSIAQQMIKDHNNIRLTKL